MWELNGNDASGSPADVVCTTGQAPCNDERGLYLLFISGDVYLYAPYPRRTSSSSFYYPNVSGTLSPDVGFGIFGSNFAVREARASIGLGVSEIQTSTSYYESVLPTGYVMPYDHRTAVQEGGSVEVPGMFLTKIARGCTVQQFGAGTCGADPRSYRFAPQGNPQLPAGGPFTWDLTGITLAFAPTSRLILDQPITITGGTLTATNPAQGWPGVQVAGETATFGSGTIIQDVVTGEGALLVSTSRDFRGMRGSEETPKVPAHALLNGVLIDRTRGGGAGLLVTGGDASASVVGTTQILGGASGPGAHAAWGGDVTIGSNDVLISRNAGGVLATGTGSRVLVLEGQISDNTGPGLHATSGGRIDALRYTTSGTGTTQNRPVRVYRNVGGLYATATGKQGGSVVSTSQYVCKTEPCFGNGEQDLRRNSETVPGGPARYDALALNTSQVIAPRNYWDGRSSAQVEAASFRDSDSWYDVSDALPAPPSATQPVRGRAAAGAAQDARLEPAQAGRGRRIDRAVQVLLMDADMLVQAGDSTEAAQSLLAAAASSASDDDRFAVSEAAGRALAVVWPPALVAWAEADVAAGGAWGRRALAVGHAGHGRTAEARLFAQALADAAGTDSTADDHRARGLGLLVGIAVTEEDSLGAVLALGALAGVDPEGAAERAVQVVRAFPGTNVSFARGTGAASRAAQTGVSAGKTDTAAELEGVSLTAGPNPSPGSVRVVLTLTAAVEARLTVFDALGREVAVLHDGPAAAGVIATFDGAAQPVGVYVVRAVVRGADGGTAVLTRRITVVR